MVTSFGYCFFTDFSIGVYLKESSYTVLSDERIVTLTNFSQPAKALFQIEVTLFGMFTVLDLFFYL